MESIWKIINTYFDNNPEWISSHHLKSYNNFMYTQIPQIMRENNPIPFMADQDPKTKEYKYRCNLYLGGRDGKAIYYGKPVIYDSEGREHFMYPNEARLRNMTYACSIHYDVDIEMIIRNEEGREDITEQKLSKIFLGRFPIMLQSKLCILNGLARNVRFNMGECRNDPGGYFIINGKEKVIICQEKFADNTLYIRDKVNDLYSHAAEIRSVSEDASKPVRTLSVRIVMPTETLTNNNIVVNIPNVRKPIPLFIVMRALGVESDKDIIKYCLLDLDDNTDYIHLFRPSIHDAGYIFTQTAALKYISTFVKHATSIPEVLQILSIYFLPHIGELNFKDKALFLGYMVKRVLAVFTKNSKPTNRDSYEYKRIEVSGMLLYQLFREYYKMQFNNIKVKIQKEYFYHKPAYQNVNFLNLIQNNVGGAKGIFSDRIVESGFLKAFKGNWGAQAHTKRLGVVQDLSRLSYYGFISHLRKMNVALPGDSAKIIGPRLLNSTQWGVICPIHSPDGGNIGLHKHFAIMANVTIGGPYQDMVKWLRGKGMKLISECSFHFLAKTNKIFINGNWIGCFREPTTLTSLIRLYRRNGLIPLYWSVYWDQERREILIWTDAGRLTRPVFYISNSKPSYDRPLIEAKLTGGDLVWNECVLGFGKKKVVVAPDNDKIFAPNELYDLEKKDNSSFINYLNENASIIEYLDVQEEEGALITYEKVTPRATHMEIHPSFIFGIMANLIAFPENNPYPRDAFSCGQSKQAVSLFHSNYQNRIDKMSVVLNYGQIPLVKSRYLKITSNEEHPYGENAIVAIATYTGFNVEDAVIFNKGSLERGIFRTTYFNMYEAYEESSKVGNTMIDTRFCNVEGENIIGLKPGFDYSHLDNYGLIKENTPLDDKTIIIGKCMNSLTSAETTIDMSVGPKKGQKGIVDKAFLTEGEEGFRLAKVRIREERVPAIGDKFSSRVGQKGTIGLVLPEADMPFTADGIRPDIIVNPHALPSRMTIGQLIECLMAKACTLYGGFGDCTAWNNKGPKTETYGKMLTAQGYHASGTQVLYNGMTGQQLEAEIYIGPTYYMRLKHMVKDKINYRARGPRAALTRQTIGGRAKGGGLRIGEMDRDVLIAHGLTGFLNQSMLERGDKYYMAICNTTGTIAIYNENKNIFLSPMADGPIKFVKSVDDTLNIINISRFGRKFSIVKVPYAFKLLYHELQTMNIQMRIITEDNINQLIPLTGSKNVEKLTGKKTLKEVHHENIRKLKESERNLPRAEPRPKKPPLKTPFFQPGVDEELSDTAAGVANPFAPPGVDEKLPASVNQFAPPGTNVPPSLPAEPAASIESVDPPPSPEYITSSPKYVPSPTSDPAASPQYIVSPQDEALPETPGTSSEQEETEEKSLLTDIVEEKKDEPDKEDKKIKLIK